ncbi:discoidin domain-containing protein [Niabella ginsenosidivorans]|uniref:discoidin domain-containing protein n=1 Tax=Niabella ginsenosidivorans TaxID=1176587 RepID=UPI0014720F1C|nr:discoidin domain-containing protein [Niabella ginsenosidivorans]
MDLQELKLQPSEKLFFTVLQGLINKTRPRIILVDKGGEGKEFWIRHCDLKVKKSASAWALFDKYKNEVSGLVLYGNRQNEHFVNLATTISGIKNALPVNDSLYGELQRKKVSLPPVLADLRSLDLETPIAIYEYLYRHYWKECNKRLYISLSPRNPNFIRDLAVATRSAVIWLDIRKKKDSLLADKFLSDMRQGSSFIMGWWPEERTGVGIGTRHGIATVAADFFENATIYAGQSQQIEMAAVPKMPELENKIYLTIFLSDGDNIQYCQHALAKLWGNEKRGAIPINWTVSPALLDAAPQLLNYYNKTATANDCLVSGPSGVGYALIYDVFRKRFNIDNALLDAYTRFSQPYLERSGLRVVTIWDDIDEQRMRMYEKNCRYLYGNTTHDWGKGAPLKTYVINDRMPFIPNRPGYTGDIEEIFRKWKDTIQHFDGKHPVFLTAQGVAWRMTPENITVLKERLEALSPGNVVVCRGDHFFNLFNQANNHYFNLCLLPDISIASKDKKAAISKVADGSPSVAHQWVASGTGPQQICFDFKEPFLINRYVVRHAGAGGLRPSLNTRSFKLETSMDNKSWTTGNVCVNNTGDVSDFDITPVRARYVRLQITDPGKDGRARIGDVEIYGKK